MVLHVSLTTVITCTSDTQICYTDYCYTYMLHGYTDMIHGYTDIHWYTFIDYLYIFLLHEFPSCHPVTWLFPVTSIDILVTGHECFWYAMCGTKCHVDLSHGATSRIPHLLYIVSHYLVSWYQQNSYPIIVLLVPCTVLVLDTCPMYCSSSWYTM